MNHWVQKSQSKKLAVGQYTAKASFGGSPCKNFNLRPIHTNKGEIIEWQLPLVGETVNYNAIAGKPAPKSGEPILADDGKTAVLRIHPDDVEIEYK